MHSFIYSCGSNGRGQLGTGNDDDVNIPICCFQTSKRVKKIGKGSNHTLILLDNGELYASGEQSGFLRLGQDKTGFIKVADNVANVCAGWEFTVLADRENYVVLYDKEGRKKLTRLEENVRSMHSSLHSVIIICDSGNAIAFGDNKKGQLFGDVITDKLVKQPHKITFEDLPNTKNHDWIVSSCCMGRDYTLFYLTSHQTKSNIMLMRCKTDRFEILKKMHSIIGKGVIEGKIGTNKSRWFYLSDDVTVVDLQSMWSSVHILYTKGAEKILQSFGNNVYGQQYISSKIDQNIQTIDVGTEHGVLVTKNRDQVYAWGWGEHGNCGPSSDGSLQMLFETNDTVENAYAGYANTFVVVTKDT